MYWPSVLERYYQLIKELYLKQKEKVILGFSLSLYFIHNQPTYGKNLKRILIIKGKWKRHVMLHSFLECNKFIIITIVIIINNNSNLVVI